MTNVTAAFALVALLQTAPAQVEVGVDRSEVEVTGDGAKLPYSAKVGKVPTKAGRDLIPDHAAQLDDLMPRIEEHAYSVGTREPGAPGHHYSERVAAHFFASFIAF